MSSQDTVVGFGPSGTIARIGNGFVEVIRDGEEVARVRGAQRLSLSKAGLLLIDGHTTLDLAGKFPQQRKQLQVHAGLTSSDACIHPDGTRLWGFRTGEQSLEVETGDAGKPHKDFKVKGVYETHWEALKALKDPKAAPALLWSGGRRRAVWDGKIDRPKAISLATKAPAREAASLTGAHLAVAEDGQTWVVHTRVRLMIGTGDELRCNVQWADADFEFATIDFENDRVVCSGKSGIAAVSFDGKLLASSAASDDRPLVSPAIAWHGEWVAVVREHDGWNPRSAEAGPETLVIYRFHATSLVPLGKLEAFKPYKTKEGLRLLALEEGALACVPRTEPILIIQSPKGAKKAVAAELPAEEASPAARLLTELDDAGAIHRMLRADPGAFVALADTVCAWDDKTLSRAAKLLPDDFWMLSYGASDAAASDLAKNIKKTKKGVDQARAKLLAGISSPIARMAVAELARKHKELGGLYQAMGIEVGDRIAAIERFARRSFDLVSVEGPIKHDVRVITGTVANKLFVDAAGWTCKTELQHVVSVDTSALAGFPSMGWFHWFATGCPEQCEERVENYVYRVSPDGRLELVQGTLVERPAAKERCAGGVIEPSRIRHWALVTPDHPEAKRARGTIGGRPQWRGAPDGAVCTKCERPMFYVGHVEATGIRAHVAPMWLFGFWCEDCSYGIQIAQT